jgi:hypothetical protein
MLLYVTNELGNVTITRDEDNGFVVQSTFGETQVFPFDSEFYAHTGTNVTAYGDVPLVAEQGSHVTAFGARVNALSGSTVVVENGAFVVAQNGAFVTAYEDGVVEAHSGSTVMAGFGSRILAHPGSSVTRYGGAEVVTVDGVLRDNFELSSLAHRIMGR